MRDDSRPRVSTTLSLGITAPHSSGESSQYSLILRMSGSERLA